MIGQIPEQDRRVRLLLDSGHHEDAAEVFDIVITDAQVSNDVDEQHGRAVVLVHRAVLAWRLGRIPLALELAAQGWATLDASEPAGPGAAQAMSMLGYLLEGHNRPALDLLASAVEVARDAGHSPTLAHCLLREGTALANRALTARADEAERFFADALDRFDETRAHSTAGSTLHRRAVAGCACGLAGLGRMAEAEQHATEALALGRAVEDRFCCSIAHWVLARVRFEQGRLSAAKVFAEQGLFDADEIHDAMLTMRFSRDLAIICAADGDPVGQAAALLRTINASNQALETLQEGLAQALEQRRLALQAQQVASAAQEAALRDPLTGLLNRRGLELRAPIVLEQTVRHGQVPWLVLIDVDSFKAVNDQAGHAIGDLTLHQIAQLLCQESRKDDLVCRWAGDEFVVLLADDDVRGAGPAVAERIRSAVDKHDWRPSLGPDIRPPTVSIGVAGGIGVADDIRVVDGGGQLDFLFAAADSALYRAKRAGRNRVELDGSGPQQSRRETAPR